MYALVGVIVIVAVGLYGVTGDRSLFVTAPLVVVGICLALVRPLSGSLDRSVRLLQLALLALAVPTVAVAAVAYTDGEVVVGLLAGVLALGLAGAIASERVWSRYRASMEARRRALEEE